MPLDVLFNAGHKIANVKLEIGEGSRLVAHNIDTTVGLCSFFTNGNKNKQTDTNPVQLKNSYPAVNSVIDKKTSILTSTATTVKAATSLTLSNNNSSNGAKLTQNIQVCEMSSVNPPRIA